MLKYQLPPPPVNTKYVERQAGGHCVENGDNLPPNLEHVDGTFLKLLRDSPRYYKELQFYEAVFYGENDEDDITTLRNLIPRFHGIFRATIEGKDVNYLKLEDITRKFRRPCVLDVKMKANEHDPHSNNYHEIFDISTKLGFLLDGLQVYDHTGHKYISYQKKFGRSLDENGVLRVLHQFISGDFRRSEQLVDSFLRRLHIIKTWLEKQKKYTFFRSSLLFVYDASYCETDAVTSRKQSTSNCTTLSTPNCQQKQYLSSNLSDYGGLLDLTDVRLVDFPKVYATSQTDTSYLRSLENLIRCFEQLKNNNTQHLDHHHRA